MKARIFNLAVLFVVGCFLFSSCAPLIIGGALGAAGGYVISKDTIQGVIERSYDSAWEASINVLKEMGAADFEYSPGGKFRAYVKDAKVNVKVTQMSEKSVRLTISARKGLLPRLKLAEEVFVKVVERTK